MPLDSAPVFSPLDRVTDADGNPASGATIEFYSAGTLTPKTVYSDPGLTVELGVVVSCDAGGYPVSGGGAKTMIYVDTNDYRIIVKDASGASIIPHDNLPGAIVTPTTSDTATPETPVVSRTSTYTILSADQGKLINADPTGGSFAMTLPSAVTVGDGYLVGVRHAGAATSYVATVRTTGGQTIGAVGQSAATSQSLIGLGHTRWYVSDGANWTNYAEVPPLMSGGLPYIKIVDRLSAPPASPVGGSRYIVTGSPTGTWATLSFAEHDIAESDGNGSWLKYTPGTGWKAWVDDEDAVSVYYDGSWHDWSNVEAPSSSALQMLVVEHQATNGTGAGNTQDASAGWVARTLNTVVSNTITGATADLSASVTLPAGTYLAMGWGQFVGVAHGQVRIKSTTTATAVSSGAVVASSANVATFFGTFTLTAAETFQFEDIATSNVVNGRGTASAASGGVEKYGSVTIVKLDAQQGPAGEQGIQGIDGLDAAYPYQWSTLTTGDPGSGKIRGNNATIASVTQVAVSETGSDGASMASVIASWDDSTSAAKGTLKWSKEGATSNFGAFRITGAGTDQGTYWTFPVTYIATGGTLSNADNGALVFLEKGDIGDPGTTVPDISGLTVLPTTQLVPTTDKGIFYDTSAGQHKAFYIPVANYAFTDPAFGAVGDDSTANDTAWSNFIDAGISDGKPLWVPAGIYRVTTAAKAVTVNTAKGFHLFGDGAASVIKRMNNLASVLLDLQGGSPVVESIKFQYSNASTAVDGNHQALRFTGCTNSCARNIHTTGAWYVGPEVRNCTAPLVEFCFSQGVVNRGFYLQSTSGSLGTKFLGNHVDGQGVTIYGINSNAALGFVPTDVVIEGNSIYNVTTHGIGGVVSGSVVNGNVIDTVTASGGVGILIEEVNGNVPDRVVVNANTVRSAAIGIGMREDDNCSVIGNLIYANAPSGSTIAINLQGSQEGTCINNIITTTANNAIGIQAARTTRSAVNYDTSEMTIARNRIRQSGTGTVGIVTDANSSSCNVDRLSNDVVGSVTALSISGTSHRQGMPLLGTYSVGDLFYASTAGTISALAAGSVGQMLTSNGAGAAPSWGYQGGTVTQATSKSTGVTLNKSTGEITMNSAALAAGSSVGFVVTNSTVAAADVIVTSIKSGATSAAYSVYVDEVSAGSFRVSLHNKSAGSLSEAVKIQFARMPGATS